MSRLDCTLARRALCVCMCLTLGACASVAEPDRAVVLPAAWRNATPIAAPVQPAPARWWQAFADPQLDALMARALADNLDVAVAHERVLAARALFQVRDAPNRPSLRFATTDPIDPDASAAFIVAGFDASWELPLFGRGRATERIARGQLGAAEADLRAARLSLTAEIARQWIVLRAAQGHAAALGRIVQARQRQLALIERRVALGLDPADRVGQARAALEQARAALAGPEIDAAIAAQTVALLLARGEPDAAWLQPAPLPVWTSPPIAAMPADLLRARPDVARREAEMLQAAGELGIAHADRLPRIGIGGAIFGSKKVLTHRRTRTNVIAAFGPLVDFPLFDWGMRKAQEQAHAHQLQVAALEYRKTALAAVAEVENALAALERQRRADVASAAVAAALAAVADRAATRRSLGLASEIDALQATVESAQAEIVAGQAGSANALAYVALVKALGGSLSPTGGEQGLAETSGIP